VLEGNFGLISGLDALVRENAFRKYGDVHYYGKEGFSFIMYSR
jgi:hypothetical protein